MLPPPLPLLLGGSRIREYDNNKTTLIDMPVQQINTVTISLSEYNEMKQSLDTLHNALEDNKIIIREPYSRGAYMTYHTFTRDAALNKVAQKYYEMEDRYKSTQKNNEYLEDKLYWMEKTWWYTLGKVFSKRNLMRKYSA